MGLSMEADKDFHIIDNLDDVVITPIGEEYHTLTARQGMTPKSANTRSLIQTPLCSPPIFAPSR